MIKQQTQVTDKQLGKLMWPHVLYIFVPYSATKWNMTAMTAATAAAVKDVGPPSRKNRVAFSRRLAWVFSSQSHGQSQIPRNLPSYILCWL